MQTSLVKFENKIPTIELKLMKMRELLSAINELQAEYDMLKNEVILTYFDENDEYKSKRGLVLATYRSYVENRFNGTRFRADNPDLYDSYKEERKIQKFLLK